MCELYYIIHLLLVSHRYDLPSRSYFGKNLIPKLYTEVAERLRADLKDVDFFACTTDMWSSRIQDPYMALTVHYITDWELQSKCLQVLYSPEDHTGENLCSLSKWELDPAKLTAFTTDNGSNIVKACQLAGYTRFHCFGHRLNLAVTNSLKDDNRMTRALGVCHKLTTHFAHSHKKKQAMTVAQIELGLSQHSLIADCEMRWGAKFKVMSLDSRTRTCYQESSCT